MPKANTVTIWICQDCMMALANDEWPDEPGLAPMPLSLITDDDEITPGMDLSEHSCDTPRECGSNCERIDFSSVPCEGCGNPDAGQRDAATLWYD